jgi:hypothetical protein
MPRALPI